MKYMKKSFKAMEPYFSKNIDDGIILNANESPFNVPKPIIKGFFKELKKVSFNRYPDMQNIKLCESIAKRFNVKPTEVTCGVGSDELIETTFKCVLEPNDKVVSFSPSFSMYTVFAEQCLAKFISVDFNEDYSFDVETMINTIKENKPKLVLICTPNNPTGAFLEETDIRRIVESTNALVILDLAYIDFADYDYTNLAMQYDNLIAFRTFSKAMAMPSLRIGYCISNEDNINMINAVKAPYSVSVPAQIMARIATENIHLYNDDIRAIIVERDRLYNELKRSFNVYPSKSNFIYLELNEEIYNALLNEKIYIKAFKNNKYRISVGTKEENDKLLKVVMNYEK